MKFVYVMKKVVLNLQLILYWQRVFDENDNIESKLTIMNPR
jgi:hypothetical protein